MSLHPGLYEQVINNALTSELAEIPEARKAVAPIDKAEASKVLAQYLVDVVQKGLDIMLQLQNSPSSSLPIVILTKKQKQRRKLNYPKRELRMTMLPKRFILA